MKLKSIKLTNIGLYKNEVITFPYDTKNNIIVVWGNNGAGKTTLINSVKVGLLGKDSVQMTYPDYCQFVKDKMMSTRRTQTDLGAEIELEVEINIDNKKSIYRICRSWYEVDGVFNEDETIYKDETILNIDEKDYIKNVISNSLPPSLLDVIVFDGENAINILNEGKMSKLIKEIIFSVFGMDVYSALSKDLTTFLRSARSNSDMTASDQMDLIKAESEYKSSLKNNKKLESLIESLKNEKTGIVREINHILRRFSDKTGIDFEEVNYLNKKICEANLNKARLNSDLKYLNEEILPLKLVHKRIKKIIDEINSNSSHKALVYLSKLKDYFQDEEQACKWIANLESLLPSEIPDVRYDVSDAELKILNDVNKLLNGHTVESMLMTIEYKNNYLKEIRNKISISNKVESAESQEMMMRLERLYSELDIINDEIIKMNEDYCCSEKLVNNHKKKDLELKSDLTRQKKESSSYIMAMKYRVAIDEFIQENIIDICSKINTILIKYLQNMAFRNSSIGKVEISPKNFEINLYEVNGSLIPSFLFSAGEKQVLLGLIIKAALLLAEIDSFFLFDTPVGRLDKKNRELFTKEVIFSVAEQSFIFATDSDYSEEDYKKISSTITAEYRLCRDENDKIVAREGSIY